MTLEIYKDGTREWFNAKGELHRSDGPALAYANGDKVWYKNGLIHRIDCPAIEGNHGAKEWWVKGKLHRLDGAACEYSDGSRAWYVNGKEYTESEFKELIQI